MLMDAVRGALSMPKLEVMVIWDGGEEHIGHFLYLTNRSRWRDTNDNTPINSSGGREILCNFPLSRKVIHNVGRNLLTG